VLLARHIYTCIGMWHMWPMTFTSRYENSEKITLWGCFDPVDISPSLLYYVLN